LSIIETITNFHETHPKELNRFIKFAIVGAIGAVIDFALLNLLDNFFIASGIFDPWSAAWNIDLALMCANLISTSVAILSNFTWNRLWAFPESRTRKKREQLVQFVVVSLIGLALNTLIVVKVAGWISPYMGEFVSHNVTQEHIVAIFGRPEPVSVVSEVVSRNIAKAVAIGIVLFWNFGVNRLWTYRGL
jgi:putative flippase GtrA